MKDKDGIDFGDDKREEKRLELAKSCSVEELEAMIQVESDSLEKVTKWAAVIALIIPALVLVDIVISRSAFDLFSSQNIPGLIIGFGTWLILFLICASIGCVTHPNPNVPIGVPKEALQLLRSWIAGHEWLAEQENGGGERNE